MCDSSGQEVQLQSYDLITAVCIILVMSVCLCVCDSSGQEVQRISVITALPSLLRENNAECMRRVVPKVRVSDNTGFFSLKVI